jgi:hypothetical protein
MEATKFELPKGLRIVMGDVTAGSATPSMVRSVLKWKDSGGDAGKIWEGLGGSNRRLIGYFNELKQFAPEAIIHELHQGVKLGSERASPNPELYQALLILVKEFEVLAFFSNLTSVNSNSTSFNRNSIWSSNRTRYPNIVA